MTRVVRRRRALHERDAADGRRHADARRIRARPIGQHRPARAHVPREHEEERVRAGRDAQHPDVADARPRLRRALARLRRRARRADQLSGAEPGGRPGAAVQFAGRAHALAAGHSAADRPGAQAGTAGAVDAVSHGRGVLPGGHSARGDFGLSRPGRRRRGGARQLRPQSDLRRHRDRRSVSRQCQGPGARSGLFEDRDRRRPGRRLGTVARRDGRERVHQQRAQLHQLLGDLGQPPHARDRRGARRAARRRPAAAARRSRGEPGRVHRARAWPTPSRRRSTPTCRRPA